MLLDRGTGDRRLLGAWPGVYCGTGSGTVAWALGDVFQINVVVGILLAYLSNYLVGLFRFGALEWRWELGAVAASALLLFLLLFCIPQSARWLAARGDMEQARRVLELMGTAGVRARA